MQTQLASDTIERICRTSPVIVAPDMTDPDLAAELAHALTRGRTPVIEVSIRGRAAAAVIQQMAQVPDAIVGAGMVISPDDVQIAREAGAQFCTTPGITDPLLRYFDGIELPVLPGAATATEAMHLLNRGYTMLNFYPVAAAGGPEILAEIHRPLPQLRFCASGNIKENNAINYLSLPNVLNVSCDWITPPDLIKARDWDAITALARAAAQLGS